MHEAPPRHFLPALMGALHQQLAEGELVLEQNDGSRKLYWAGGDLVYLRSDAGGEQFGNYLIRRGVLDMASLKELLAEGEHARVGDRVVQCGLMTVEERDSHLQDLFSSVLLHAMEHPILKATWHPGPLNLNLSGDLQFWLDHRHLVWDTFHSARIDQDFSDMFRKEPDWRWSAREDLLDCLRDLPLTPAFAYALTLLGTEPLGYSTIESVTGLGTLETARTVATLWALGGLRLVEGTLPMPSSETHQPPPPPQRRAPEPAPAPKPLPDPDPEMIITLVEEETLESPIEEEAAPDSSHPMTLMDVLELEAQAPIREFHSPAGPAPRQDPFTPTPLAAGKDPFFAAAHEAEPTPAEAPAGIPHPQPLGLSQPPHSRSEPTPRPLGENSPLAAQLPIQTAEPPSPAPHPPWESQSPPHALPLAVNDEDLPPMERARHLVVKAKSYLLQSRTSEAARALEQAIKLDGTSLGSYEAWLLLGKLRLANPAWSTRAIEALQVAARINPKSAQPWALMGDLYHRKGFRANAQGCFRRAWELDPSVAIPPEYQDLEALSPPEKEHTNPGTSLVGRLRGMFGMERSSRS